MNTNMTRRAFATTMGAASMAALAACGGNSSSSATATEEKKEETTASAEDKVKVVMVTDTGGVNDHSFNELSWAGMQQLGSLYGWDVSYLESKQDSDYMTNLDTAVDSGAALVWGVGFAMGDAVNDAAKANPDVQFAIIDSTNNNGASNLTGVSFRQEECSFAVGYVAARATKSGKVGFVGGINSELMQSFEQGYYAGIEFANMLNDTTVTYQGQWAESFTDAAKGKAIAQSMIADGCDVIFHAAGGTGDGMIEACGEANIWAIGVDKDQSILDPKHVITSALKRVDQAVIAISTEIIESGAVADAVDGNVTLGASEDAVGIAETHDVLDSINEDIYLEALGIIELIKLGTIEVPTSADGLKTFVEETKSNLDEIASLFAGEQGATTAETPATPAA